VNRSPPCPQPELPTVSVQLITAASRTSEGPAKHLTGHAQGIDQKGEWVLRALNACRRRGQPNHNLFPVYDGLASHPLYPRWFVADTILGNRAARSLTGSYTAYRTQPIACTLQPIAEDRIKKVNRVDPTGRRYRVPAGCAGLCNSSPISFSRYLKWGDLAEDQYTHVFQHTSGWVSSARLVDLASRWTVIQPPPIIWHYFFLLWCSIEIILDSTGPS